MNVILGSAFRNSSSHAHMERYFRQAAALRMALRERGDSLYLVAAEGDSTDDTRARLLAYTYSTNPGVVVDVSHGLGWFGSTEDPERFRALAGVGNGILEQITPLDNILVYVESDLIWDPAAILRLASHLGPDIDVVAPLIFAGECFYDVFAYRSLDGQRFGPFPPYSHAIVGPLSEIGSAGSCLVMKGEVARACRIPLEDGLVGFCRNARSKGYRIWVDNASAVRHP